MPRLAIHLALAVLVAAPAPAAAAPHRPRRVGNAELLRYAASGFDKARMMFKRDVVGLHRGTLVVADFPCGDVCPAYTRRIIHYDVAPEECARVGGIIVAESVPRGPAAAKHDFCEPAVLAGNRPAQ